MQNLWKTLKGQWECDNDFNIKEASNRNVKSDLHSVEIKNRLLRNLLFGGLCVGLIENVGSKVELPSKLAQIYLTASSRIGTILGQSGSSPRVRVESQNGRTAHPHSSTILPPSFVIGLAALAIS